MDIEPSKPVEWLGSTQEDIRDMPEAVRRVFGYALYIAQMGGVHPDAKPLRGYGGHNVMEVVANFDGDTYREVYTVRFEEAVYILHVFQKKSHQGIRTPQRDLATINARLKQAEARHRQYLQAKRQQE